MSDVYLHLTRSLGFSRWDRRLELNDDDDGWMLGEETKGKRNRLTEQEHENQHQRRTMCTDVETISYTYSLRNDPGLCKLELAHFE